MDWIDVKQVKPRSGQVVLVYADGYFEVVQHRRKCIASDVWETHAGLPIDRVTHWMPLPAGPDRGEGLIRNLLPASI